MVQFGQTLNDVVKNEPNWRSHAVPYMALKQVLRTNNTSKDDDSTHTDSPYTITTSQKTKFGKLFDESVINLVAFYKEKAQQENLKYIKLEQEVNMCLGGTDVIDISRLIDRITEFSQDVKLTMEFLELNVVAYSKIMKKFDKRTGLHLREYQIQRLKSKYYFLFDGGILKHMRTTSDDWLKQLYFLYTKLRASTGSRITSGGITGNLLNPQETEGSNDSKKCVSWGDEVGSIIETEESRFIASCIEKVNEEIIKQKKDSPFFDSLPPRNAPPSFECNEVKLSKVLGMGEYCRIHEVSRFDVPETCLICFMHRGFNPPSLSEELPSNENGSTNSTLSTKSKLGDANGNQIEATRNEATKIGENSNGSSTLKNTPADEVGHSRNVSWGEIPRNVSWGEIPKFIPSYDSSKALAIAEKPNPPKKWDRQSTNGSISIFCFEKYEDLSDIDDFESDHEDEFDHETRGFMKDHCLRNGDARYAIKRIKHELKGEDAVDAAIDLVREGHFLAGLSHPGIIKIRGTCGVPGHPRYSIVLDRLFDTLEVRMRTWKEEVKEPNVFLRFSQKSKTAQKKSWINRLLCAYDIAHAMHYLHSHGILHRDLKPANIGFDVRGDIKIFDFGLAKELKPCDKVGPDQFHTSGIAGTRRYMAPEVAQVIPYGLSADVYSYSIVMWEMMTLQPAFPNYTRAKHFKEVIVEGKRPKIPRSWPYVEKNLLERCWSANPADRPSFQAICQLIKFGLPEETYDSNRSTDLATRSIRSGRDMHHSSLQKKSGHSKKKGPTERIPKKDELETKKD